MLDNDSPVWESDTCCEGSFAVGPLRLSEGEHVMTFEALPAGSAPGPLVELSNFMVDGRPLPPSSFRRGTRTASTRSDGPTAHVATFETRTWVRDYAGEEVLDYFLKYEPLVSSWSWWASPEQDDAFAVSGSWSARFYEGILYGLSSLTTVDVPIPDGSEAAFVVVKLRAEDSGSTMAYKAHLNGETIREGTFRFDRDPLDWVTEQVEIPARPPGSVRFTFEIRQLVGRATSNVIYMDDLTIGFRTKPATVHGVVVANSWGKVSSFDPATGARLWSFSSAGGFDSSEPVQADGAVFFGSGRGPAEIYRLDGRTGESQWHQSLEGGILATPVIMGGWVHVATNRGILYVLEPTTGGVAATVDFMGLPPATQTEVNGLAIASGVAYIATKAGLFAVRLDPVRWVDWHACTGASFWEAPVVANGRIFAGDLDGNVYSIDHDGTIKWQHAPADRPRAPIYASLQFAGGAVVYGDDAGWCTALDASTGDVIWSVSVPGEKIQAFVVSGRQLFIVGTAVTGHARAFQMTRASGGWTLEEIWKRQITNGSRSAPLVSGGNVFVSGGDRRLYALRSSDGSDVWPAVDLERPTFTSPTLFTPDPTTDKSRSYSRYCYLTAHNAFVNGADGWYWRSQTRGLTAQLNEGVRALMLDVWDWVADGRPILVLRHGSSGDPDTWRGWAWSAVTASRPLRDALQEIRVWMENNPSEVVTLILEQRIDPARVALLEQTFEAADLQRHVFFPTSAKQPTTAKWGDVKVMGWPTLDWMVAHGTRLVVLSDQRKYSGLTGPKPDDGYPFVWDYAVENGYGTWGMAYTARGGSEPIGDRARALFIMNHFYDYQPRATEPRGYAKTNDYERIISRAWTFAALFNGRLPNFLAVDFYEDGDNGGPQEVVRELNSVWSTTAAWPP